jgi:maleylacetoacetate isomerase
MNLKLYTFFRSSAAFRVRIALNLKGLPYEQVGVSLAGGKQFDPGYKAVNPQARVPTLIADGKTLYQSMAIMEWLEEVKPEPPLLPKDAFGRARARGLANVIANDIHPLNNLAVLKYLATFKLTKEQIDGEWYPHWITVGFSAFEEMLQRDRPPGRFCHGDAPGMADICLVPQVFNAQRYKVNLTPYPAAMRAFEECMKLDAFDRAQPTKQPDAVA